MAAASSSNDTYPPPQSSAEESLSPLEQEVLDEYAKLNGNLQNLSSLLATLSSTPSAEILDALRGLERKTSLVFTLLKASVYSIVLQQQYMDEWQDAQGDAHGVGEEHDSGVGGGLAS